MAPVIAGIRFDRKARDACGAQGWHEEVANCTGKRHDDLEALDPQACWQAVLARDRAWDGCSSPGC
jgi:hypothetical protein